MEGRNLGSIAIATRASALSLLVAATIAVAGSSIAAAEPIDGAYLTDKASFLCNWRKAYPENPIPLPACDDAKGIAGAPARARAIYEMQSWWQWMFNTKMNAAVEIRGAFLDDWESAHNPIMERELRATRERASADRKENDARLHAELVAAQNAFAKEAPAFTNEQLCVKSHESGYSEAALTELKRRGALKANEWKLISAREIAIGFSETALLCSWGAPAHINRTVTAAGTHKQYIYSEGTLVYVDNGLVTSLQDTQ